MKKWSRSFYTPCKPLYEGRMPVTASPDHIAMSRKAASEGMVLLKNENQLLPLGEGQKVAVFGKALFDYVKGGGGSGDVSVSYVRSLYDGLLMYKGSVCLYEPLADFYKGYVRDCYARGDSPGLIKEPEPGQDLFAGAADFTDTAMIVISRFSGEAWDRQSVSYEGQEEYEAEYYRKGAEIFGESDYYLTPEERLLIGQVRNHFKKIILVLNVGGVIDSSWFAKDPSIGSVLLAWQGGMEGGAAMADILLGRVNPSGKLPDTLARSLNDYPSTAGFHASPDYVDYTEDIYVGYRYFETMEGAKDAVNYPFGFGLSYTSFIIESLMACQRKDKIYITVRVENSGDTAGKEVVQVYVSAPDGRLGKAARSLVAFEKTRLLAPGQSQLISFEIPVSSLASYDDTGRICRSAYILEKGHYSFYVGNSVRDLFCMDFCLDINEDIIVSQKTERCQPRELKFRLLSDGETEKLRLLKPWDHMENGLGWSDEPIEGVMPALRGRERIIPDWVKETNEEASRPPVMLLDVAQGKAKLDDLLAQMTEADLCDLLGGQPNQGVANTFGFGNNISFGIPNLMTTDGPAGVRILPEHEIYTTAWPCSTLLASTWNRDLLYDIGLMAAEEVKENNLSIWLAPAVNIHRNPLCGRNFEYYSEDPLLAGELAAAMICGVQSLGVGCAVKHFACNNKESNRKDSDSRLSERALREIYLKAFEIIIQKSSPWVVMSSYNLINGVRASENKDLLTGILREEWGFDGVVCSDWYTHGEHYKELLAGNDIKMGCGYPERLMQALDKGLISRQDLVLSARRILHMILKAD